MFKLFIAADKPEGCEPIQTYLNNNFRDLFHIDKKNVDEAILLAEVIYHRPDFIFFDIERPKLSVLKVAAQIRTYLPDCKMVIISVFHNLKYTRAALSLGADEYIDKPISAEKMKTAMYRVLMNIKPQAFSIKMPVSKRIEERTSRAKALLTLAINYLERNYQQDISLEDTAKTIQISTFYLSRLFKKTVGENFTNYLTAVRINKAKEFLTDPRYTIKDVCYQVGYKDPNYFARVFKKTCGITPTEYQTNHLSLEKEAGSYPPG